MIKIESSKPRRYAGVCSLVVAEIPSELEVTGMLAAKAMFGAGILIFYVSCCAPVCETYLPWEPDCEDRLFGFQALTFGWLLMIRGCPAWFANPLMLYAAVLMRFKLWSRAVVMASIAFCCAPTIFAMYSPFPVLGDKPEAVFCVGGWLWLSAIACMWMGTVLAWITCRCEAITNLADQYRPFSPPT